MIFFNRFIAATILALTCQTISSGDTYGVPEAFRKNFADTTLRVDLIFAANPKGEKAVYLHSLSSFPKWAGRRVNLSKLLRQGAGTVTITDAASADTLYRNSFSSLFHEWLETDEATATPKAFEHTVLLPMPLRPAKINVELLNSRHQPIAAMTSDFDPADILIVNKGNREIPPHKYIHKGGDPSEAIDVVILAEGYTKEEVDSFYRHARVAVDAIFSHEPFKSRKDDFNFLAVATPSVDSGVSVPRLGDWKSTAFSSNFSTFYSDRYLTSLHVSDIHDAIAGLPYEHIIILANTPEYGGGGIFNSYTLTTSRHGNFRPVVVHEFGHSFGGLADEYFYENDVMSDTYPLDVEPWEPNVTTLVDFSGKWQSILPDSVPVPTPVKDADKYPIGVYEGAAYAFKGIYRPADHCRMRDNDYPAFCPACQAAISTLIDFYLKE